MPSLCGTGDGTQGFLYPLSCIPRLLKYYALDSFGGRVLVGTLVKGAKSLRKVHREGEMGCMTSPPTHAQTAESFYFSFAFLTIKLSEFRKRPESRHSLRSQ